MVKELEVNEDKEVEVVQNQTDDTVTEAFEMAQDLVANALDASHSVDLIAEEVHEQQSPKHQCIDHHLLRQQESSDFELVESPPSSILEQPTSLLDMSTLHPHLPSNISTTAQPQVTDADPPLLKNNPLPSMEFSSPLILELE